MPCFYHYTSLRNFGSILDGGDYGKPGLLPLRRFVPLGLSDLFNLPDQATNNVGFGLLEPMPRAWLLKGQRKDIPLLDDVIRNKSCMNMPVVLLRIVASADDDLYVGDFSPHLIPNPTGDSREHLKIINQKYWNSLTPFYDYLKNPSYLLPEVIFFSPIPVERIYLERVFSDERAVLNEFRTASGRPQLPPNNNHASIVLSEVLGLSP